MSIKIFSPEVNPNIPERFEEAKFLGKINKEIGNNLKKTLNDEKDIHFDIDIETKKTTVYLSGEANFKSVANWMRKHMETYPETRNGFFIKFIDDDKKLKRGFMVTPCRNVKSKRVNGKDFIYENLNGVDYKISKHEFSSNKKISEQELEFFKNGKRDTKNEKSFIKKAS